MGAAFRGMQVAQKSTKTLQPNILSGLASGIVQLPRYYVETEALTVIYDLLQIVSGATRSRNAIREPWDDTPEYKEYLTNQLKMAQIDSLSKLQMTQVDRNLRQTCRYNKETEIKYIVIQNKGNYL